MACKHAQRTLNDVPPFVSSSDYRTFKIRVPVQVDRITNLSFGLILEEYTIIVINVHAWAHASYKR